MFAFHSRDASSKALCISYTTKDAQLDDAFAFSPATPPIRVCRAHDIEHRLTQPNHPWTNGQVERMNRTIKEATIRAFHYASAIELKRHLHAFLPAYNCARRLKTLKDKNPYESIFQRWTIEPERFKIHSHHHTPALNT